MPIDSAINFDRRKDFAAFFGAEPVGATRWLSAVLVRGGVSGELPRILADLLAVKPTPEAVAPLKGSIELAGKALTVPISQFKPDELRAQGLVFPDQPPTPMVRGTAKLVPTTKELGLRIALAVGQREFPLVCNDEALECFAADLSAFSGSYDVGVVGWPDGSGQIFVEEAAPLLALPNLGWSDWAQGRLFDNGVVGGPVVLRVNAHRQIMIADSALQDRLRPFIGTGVVIYGRRTLADDGTVSLRDVYPEMWFLTRLTNPADPDNSYAGAPRPAVVDGRSLCIGATPPWNWQGPNVETHIVAPVVAASLASTEERRVVFGKPASALPTGWPNPVNHLSRVIEASACAEPPISTVAHIATRRAPRSATVTNLRGIAELTSAELTFAA
jgi:hypothetical protein